MIIIIIKWKIAGDNLKLLWKDWFSILELQLIFLYLFNIRCSAIAIKGTVSEINDNLLIVARDD